MFRIPSIDIRDYFYDLPQERIAQFPLEQRDASRLLVADNGIVTADRFFNLPAYLPHDALLVYNKTRVVQARLQFAKTTGAPVEIFCLEPVEPTREIQLAFEQRSGVVWQCLVGNSKKWKSGALDLAFNHGNKNLKLTARRLQNSGGTSLIDFQWDPAGLSFSEILQAAGLMPLPPYMKRESEESDKLRYQTVYAKDEGSVAAPTAGLHFTPEVFEKLARKNVSTAEVTLHVGAGTFKPVSSQQVGDHEMHAEQVLITKETIESLLNHAGKPVIAVGTTTMRTLESLYWHGVKSIVCGEGQQRINVEQWDPYNSDLNIDIPLEESLLRVLTDMNEHGLEEITGQTRLMIVPGYRVRIPSILVTNFHMPQSTLLLLVSAFIGESWREAYRYALENDFRFLSYGDSCLFFRRNKEISGWT